jgi:hypothetical protein
VRRQSTDDADRNFSIPEHLIIERDEKRADILRLSEVSIELLIKRLQYR